MEKDFHFYLVYAIARITGFQQAGVIATASQFVDDNNEGQFSIDGLPAMFPEKIPTGNGNYYPIMTQSLSPKSLDPYVQKYVYIPFHFLPGDNTVEIDGRKNPLSTTPGSANAETILKKALASDNPYLLGIALHTYADTWSHQNFTGLQESWNSVYPWYRVFKSLVPNIGHAEAGHSPDVISEEWTDHRLGAKIKNTTRALAATGAIYKALRRKSGSGPYWTEIKREFRIIIHADGYDDRKVKIRELLHKQGLGELPKYDKNAWIDEALDRNGNRIVLNPGFEETHWYFFHQAAKVQFSSVFELINDLL
jgi:hypothetical protein